MCRQRTIIFMWQNYVWGGLQFSFHTFWSYITPCWRVSKREKRQREGEIEKKKARFIGNVYLSKAVQIKGRLLASCRHSERQLPLPHFRHHEKWVWSPKDHEPKVCRVRRRPYVRVAERERKQWHFPWKTYGRRRENRWWAIFHLPFDFNFPRPLNHFTVSSSSCALSLSLSIFFLKFFHNFFLKFFFLKSRRSMKIEWMRTHVVFW